MRDKRLGDLALRAATAAGLGVDAYVHAVDASYYSAPRGGAVTQATLFVAETVAATLAGLFLLAPARPALRSVAWLVAAAVSASALGGLLLYRYVDVGVLGPIPDMYEPAWAVRGKLLSAYAEGAALLLSVAGYLRSRRARPA